MLKSKLNIAYVFVGLLIFLNLFRFPITFHGEITDERLYLIFLMQISVMIVIAALLWEINRWISMFVILTTVSIFCPHLSRESYFSGVSVMLGLLWFYFIVKHVQHTDKLLDAICIIALANVLFIMLQFFNIDPMTRAKSGGPDMPVGFLNNVNEVSALLAFSLPAFLRVKWIWLIPFVILGLILSKSMGGIAAAAAGMVFYFGVHGYKFLPIAVSLVALCLYAIIFDNNLISAFQARYQASILTLQYYLQHWIFGSGIGHFKLLVGKDFLLDIGGNRWNAVHNEYVQGLFEMGIAFGVLVIGYFVDVWRKVRGICLPLCPAALPLSALVIIAVNSTVHFPFHIAPTAILALTWMAILQVQLRPEEVRSGSDIKGQSTRS